MAPAFQFIIIHIDDEFIYDWMPFYTYQVDLRVFYSAGIMWCLITKCGLPITPVSIESQLEILASEVLLLRRSWL